MLTPDEKARILIDDIGVALTRGTKHYNVAGHPLLTVLAVIDALRRDGSIEIEGANAQ